MHQLRQNYDAQQRLRYRAEPQFLKVPNDGLQMLAARPLLITLLTQLRCSCRLGVQIPTLCT
jgi:hypothetical protein